MNPARAKLRSHLDPIAVRILKKRLVSGQITPQVFKDILKRQMVKHYFQSYRHPLFQLWRGRRGPFKKRTGMPGSSNGRSENPHSGHKHF